MTSKCQVNRSNELSANAVTEKVTVYSYNNKAYERVSWNVEQYDIVAKGPRLGGNIFRGALALSHGA